MAQLKGTARARYIQTMFGQIAGRYDLMNRLMSAGQDQVWRRLVVEAAALPPGGRLLDIATGTGDIAFEAIRRDPALRAIGADFSLEMMRVGQRKQHNMRISWVGADTLQLPFPDGNFDAVTSGFLMRNVIDVRAAFAEQCRVVRPGGRVVCLEISRPAGSPFTPLFRWYFHGLVPLVGQVIGGNRDAYTYLPDSAEQFLTPEELKREMEAAGLRQVRYRRLMLGTVAIHIGARV